MEHKHIYDKQGNQLCCTPQEGKIYKDAGAKKLLEDDRCCSTKSKNPEVHSGGGGHDHNHSNTDKSTFQMFLPAIISLVILLLGIGIDNFFPQQWFTGWVRIVWYAIAYAPVGLPVLKEAFESIREGDVFRVFSDEHCNNRCIHHW